MSKRIVVLICLTLSACNEGCNEHSGWCDEDSDSKAFCDFHFDDWRRQK